MNTKLTVPIAAETESEALALAKKAAKVGAQMLEIRFDYIKGLTPEKAAVLIKQLKSSPETAIPVISTCRCEKEGGAQYFEDALRIRVLDAALMAGSDCIDFEYESFLNADNQEKIKLAMSQVMHCRLIRSTTPGRRRPSPGRRR